MLQLALLGEMSVSIDGRQGNLPRSRKTRALLAYLALTGRPHRRDHLCAMFWNVPDDPRGALRWSLSKLRALVNEPGQPRIQADREVVGFDCAGTSIDVLDLRQQLRADPDSMTVRQLSDAAATFRGELLEGLDLDSCPDFQAWCLAERAELRAHHCRVLTSLAAQLAGEPELALPHVRALVRLDPYDESARVLLLQVLTAAGRREEAEKQYELSMRTLAELGAPPSGALERAWRELRKPTPAPSAPEPSPDYQAAPLLQEKQDIRFCMTADRVRIAFASAGSGPPLVKTANWLNHLEFDWRSPVWCHLLGALARDFRLIRYDERGNGLSDWAVEDFSIDALVRDLETVVDAAGLDRFPLLAISQGCAVAISYAVKHPERVSCMVLHGGYARGWRARGNPIEIAQREAMLTLVREGWGQDNPAFHQIFASRHIPDGTLEQWRWWNDLQRITTSPDNAVKLMNALGQIDVMNLLPQVSVPTLVLHSRNDAAVPFEAGRELATSIPGARFLPLDSRNHLILEQEPAWPRFLEEIRGFLHAPAIHHEPASSGIGHRPGRATAVELTERGAGTEPSAERKQITVLVAVVGRVSGADAEGDPETLMQEIDPALEAIKDIVRRYDGSISVVQSDGLTALFGAPVAHEDHAMRACHAANAMQAAVRDRRDGNPSLRVGLHSGEAVVRTTGDRARLEAIGPVVSLAARVSALAEPGDTVLTMEAARRAEGFVHVQPLAASAASDLRHDLVLLRGITTARTRWEVRAARGVTPFIGRDGEVDALVRAMQRVGTGSGEVVAVVADPGVGKSRLVHEFVRAAVPTEWAVFETGAAAHDSKATYRPISGLLRAWFGVEERDLKPEIERKLRTRIEDSFPELRSAIPALMSLLDLPVTDATWSTLSPPQRRRRILDAVKSVLACECRGRPVVLLFEDLHWIDGETQAVLDTLVDSLGALRLFLLVTHRPEYRHGWIGKSYFSQIRLHPLAGEMAERLLSSLLGNDRTLDGLRRDLLARTEGTPLFVEETVRALAEAGALLGRPGGYRLGQPVTSLEIPSTVQAVIAARIDRLQASTKNLLQVASVIGRDVPLALLKEVAGLPEDALHEALAELQAAEFLYEVRLVPDVEYSFKHALTHEVAYGSVLRERRSAIHVEIVRTIEKLSPDRIDEQVERLAHHCVKGRLWDQAIRYLYRAANKAIHRSAHGQAMAFLQQGLELIGKLSDDRARLQTELDYQKTIAMMAMKGWGAQEVADTFIPTQTPAEGRARLQIELDYQKAIGVTMMAMKGWGAQEVADAYIRAQTLAETLADDRELFVVLRGQGQFHMIRGEVQTARGFGDRCVALAKKVGDPAMDIETHHLFWSNSFFMGDYAGAAHHAEHGIRLYDRQRDHRLTYMYSGHDPGVCCRCFSGLALWQQGEVDRALARSREALALASDLSHPLTTGLAHWGLSYLHLLRREPIEAQNAAEQEIAVCEEYMLPLLLSQGRFQLGWALAAQGALDEGIGLMRRGLAAISATGAEMGRPHFSALLGEALARAGRPRDGLSEIETALGIVQKNQACFQLSEIKRLKGELLLMLPGYDADAAIACFRDAMATAREQGAPLLKLRAATSLARVLIDKRKRVEARALLTPLFRTVDGTASSPELQEAHALLGA